MKEKDFIVYRLPIADQLVSEGYKLLRTGINVQNIKYKVFFFENTQELRARVKELTQK